MSGATVTPSHRRRGRGPRRRARSRTPAGSRRDRARTASAVLRPDPGGPTTRAWSPGAELEAARPQVAVADPDREVEHLASAGAATHTGARQVRGLDPGGQLADVGADRCVRSRLRAGVREVCSCTSAAGSGHHATCTSVPTPWPTDAPSRRPAVGCEAWPASRTEAERRASRTGRPGAARSARSVREASAAGTAPGRSALTARWMPAAGPSRNTLVHARRRRDGPRSCRSDAADRAGRR